jgi:catechol 2,3-dioxygenase-like lactoylglutathione lyase family enzyme
MRVEHLGIYATDPEGLSQWYREKLGFSVVRTLEKEGRPPIYFLKGEGGWEIEILPSPSSRPDKQLTDPGYSHIGLVVDSFEQTERLLKSKGISLHDVRDTSNGWKIGYFEDPEGNILEIVYRPRGG